MSAARPAPNAAVTPSTRTRCARCSSTTPTTSGPSRLSPRSSGVVLPSRTSRPTRSRPRPTRAKQRAADLAVWALAEELAGHPRGWYPLVELGRLSLEDDQEAALRRFATAAERDPSGLALAESMELLREAGLPVDALGLGVGHWRAKEHTPAAGRQLVLAAIDADRIFEAKHHLESLGTYPDAALVAPLQTELKLAIAQAEQHRSGT
ncbi:hypothetical protein NKG05_25410 [Oerskovia sp. M15]